MLGRAKTLMQGWVAPAPPVATQYNVACANGHRLRGNRTEGYQALRCPTCAEAVFILPQSPLPEPPVPTVARSPTRSRSTHQTNLDTLASDDAPHVLVDPPAWSEPAVTPGTRAAATASDDEVVDIDWVDGVEEPAASATAPAGRPNVVPPASSPPAARPATPRPKPARPVPPAAALLAPAPLAIPAPRPTFREWTWSHRNPLLAVGFVLLVLGAVGVKRWKQRQEELPRIAEIGRTEGLKKLDSGDFFAAKKILADAAAAVDAMGGRFAGGDAIRHAAQEAAIFTDLVPQTLEDLVEEAATYDVNAWSAHFAAIYQGRSIIIETTITAIPDPAKPESRYTDAYRIAVGRGPTPQFSGRIDYTGFELFTLTEPNVGDTKLFGARLAALECDLTTNIWVLKLEPRSGVFMTHPEALQAINWPAGEPVEESQP